MKVLEPSLITKLPPWDMLFVPDEGKCVDVGRGIVNLPGSTTATDDEVYVKAVKKALGYDC